MGTTIPVTYMMWDEERKEPYLQLPSFPDIRLVPYRPGMAEGLARLFNIPMIGKRLYSLPFPFPLEFAQRMESKSTAEATELLTTMQPYMTIEPSGAVAPPASPPGIGGLLFRSLRDVSTGQIIGDFNLSPPRDIDKMVPRDVLNGPAIAPATKDQTWEMGYVLDPVYHGKGLGTAMTQCVIEGWVKPWMGIGKLEAISASDNPASIGVLRRCGFQHVVTFVGEWPKEKGGGQSEAQQFRLILHPTG